MIDKNKDPFEDFDQFFEDQDIKYHGTKKTKTKKTEPQLIDTEKKPNSQQSKNVSKGSKYVSIVLLMFTVFGVLPAVIRNSRFNFTWGIIAPLIFILIVIKILNKR